MSRLTIREDFIDGVQEIFTTLFNGGVEDGLDLYLLSDKTKINVYRETKVKLYQPPIKLVTQAHITPIHGEQTVEGVKADATFVVPLKDLLLKEVDISTEGLEELRRGIIGFHDTFYRIDNIIPKAYVEDVFLMYTFVCTEELHMKEIALSEMPKPI